MLSAPWRNFPYSPAPGIFGFEQGKLFAFAGKAQGKAARSVIARDGSTPTGRLSWMCQPVARLDDRARAPNQWLGGQRRHEIGQTDQYFHRCFEGCDKVENITSVGDMR